MSVDSTSIDSTAMVSPECELGSGVRIGPQVIVEPGVVVGDGCSIAARAILKRGLRLVLLVQAGPPMTKEVDSAICCSVPATAFSLSRASTRRYASWMTRFTSKRAGSSR